MVNTAIFMAEKPTWIFESRKPGDGKCLVRAKSAAFEKSGKCVGLASTCSGIIIIQI